VSRSFFVINNVTRGAAASKTRKATATATSRSPLLSTPRPSQALPLEPPFYVSTERPDRSRAADDIPDAVPFEGRALPDGGELAQPAPVRPRTRGLHSSTFRLNVSALRGIGGACKGCLGGFNECRRL
jgi:hypothetical protein